jgi:lipopolysaccharide export system protein LptA
MQMQATDRRRAAALFLAVLAVFAAPAALAQSETSRLTGLQLSGDAPIEIESDKLEVRESENIAVFTGNVSVTQGPTLLKSGSMTVHYAEGGSATTGSADIERLEVDGKVYIKSEAQVATGDRGTFDMASEVMVLTGDEVVLSEGDNVIVGCKLTVNMKTGEAQLDGCGGRGEGGRVKMLLQPQQQ